MQTNHLRLCGAIWCCFALTSFSVASARVDVQGNKDGPVFGGELILLVAEPFGRKGYMVDLGGVVGRMDHWDTQRDYELDLSAHGWNDFIAAIGGDKNVHRLRWSVVASTNHYGPNEDTAAYWGVETTVARFEGWEAHGAIKQVSRLQGRLDTLIYSINGQLGERNETEDKISFWTTEQNSVFNPGEGGWAPDWGSGFPGEASGELEQRLDMYRYGANSEQTEGTWFRYPGFWQLTREGRLRYQTPK